MQKFRYQYNEEEQNITNMMYTPHRNEIHTPFINRRYLFCTFAITRLQWKNKKKKRNSYERRALAKKDQHSSGDKTIASYKNLYINLHHVNM